MSDSPIPLAEWLGTFQKAAGDFAAGSMRFDPRLATVEDDGSRPGTYIAILSDRNSVHLGLTAPPDGIRALARALLGLRMDQEVGEKDVVDGVSEVMNIVAGKVKSHMAGRDGQLQLGLPMFVVHPIAGGSGMEVASADVMMGPVPVRLSIYRRALAARRAA